MSGAHGPQLRPRRSSSFGRGTFSGLARVSSASTDGEHPRVRRRLSALFGDGDGSPPSANVPLSSSPSAAAHFGTSPGVRFGSSVGNESALMPAEPFKDRNAIKVLVVTWNMADALPKGDLSVLLGEVPVYEEVEKGDDLPELSVENAHPYHVVVIAAQECPAPSGMPRGLGGTLMKGVGLQKSDGQRRERDERKEKKDGSEGRKGTGGKGESKTEDEEGRKTDTELKNRDLTEGKSSGDDNPTAKKADKPASPMDKSKSTSISGLDKLANGTPVNGTPPNGAPRPLLGRSSSKQNIRVDTTWSSIVNTAPVDRLDTPTNHILVQSPIDDDTLNDDTRLGVTPSGLSAQPSLSQRSGTKGWSAMLEEWFCAGPPVTRPAMQGQVNGEVDAFDSPVLGTSYPASSAAAKPIGIPSKAPTSSGLMPPQASSLARSPNLLPPTMGRQMGRSVESSSSYLSPPEDRPSLNRSPSERTLTLGRSPMEYGLQDKTFRKPGAGPYVNVAKERLLGLYTSVFVYKGCEHLVQGVDKDFVTAGLAGGRFGNKGGIGISLNLAGHRLLFVNAHLAAHAERNDARLANIAKIKSELNLNCFLPADDPRAMMEDITDRFDTTFWCGDLNFRVDISLLHAKWLLEQKKYNDALMFDQLKTIMSDPVNNPLPGFQEADITFMPTFKYDVWKSLRATNRELRRSVRHRRRTMEKQERPSSEITQAPGGALEFVPEVEGTEESGSDAPPDSPEALVRSCPLPAISPIAEVPPMETKDTPATADWRSESSVGDLDVSASYADTDNISNELSQSQRSNISSALAPSVEVGARFSRDLTRPTTEIPLRKTIGFREKTKKLLGILALGRKSKPRSSTPKDDSSARRTSMSSYRSFLTSTDGGEEVLSPRVPQSSLDEPRLPGSPPPLSPRLGSPAFTGGAAIERNASALSTSSRRITSPPRRNLSLMHRSISGRSLREEDLPDEDVPLDNSVDHRIGVYDTSKKQRIPSWCDRVLWKSHIIPDEDESLARMDSNQSPFFRLSNALSNISGRFRRPSTMFDSTLSSLPQGATSSRTLSTSASAPVALEGVAPDELSPVFEDSAPHTPVNETPDPTLLQPQTPSRTQIGTPLTASPENVLNADPVPSPPPRETRAVTFDHPRRTLSESAQDASPGRRRAASVSVESSPSLRAASLRRSGSLSRRLSVGSAGLRRRSADPPAASASLPPLVALHPAKTTGHSLDDARARRLSEHRPSESLNVFTRFLRDLPGRFHSRVSLFHASDDVSVREPEPDRPRRHLAGEVDVLHYGTIDDAGMRALEGRSDHRPAIFAAAVYV